MSIKYVHTTIIARDWMKLSDFYIQVFGCKPASPAKNHSGQWIEKMTGIEGVNIKGIHLILPGFTDGPILEIFQYNAENPRNSAVTANQQGFNHIAFQVDAVEEVLEKTIEFGGRRLGELVTKEMAGVGLLTTIYAQDPEDNIIEILNWQK